MKRFFFVGSAILAFFSVSFSQDADTIQSIGSVEQEPRIVEASGPATPVATVERVAAEEKKSVLGTPVQGEQGVSYESPHGLGFSAGMTTGIGFAYRKHFENRYGVHIGLMGLGSRDESQSTYWGNVGGQLMYTFHRVEKKFFRFYGLAGGSVIFWGNNYYYPNRPDYSPNPERRWDHSRLIILGAGIGMEFTIVQRIGFSLELPLSTVIDEGGGFAVQPIPNASLVYFF